MFLSCSPMLFGDIYHLGPYLAWIVHITLKMALLVSSGYPSSVEPN